MKKIIPVLAAMILFGGCGNAVSEPQNADDVTDALPFEENIATAEMSSDRDESYGTEPLSSEENEAGFEIWLRASSTELLVGEDDDEIIWYAEIPPDCEPEKVELIDADTNEVAAELFDEADYEKYGDTIKGDSVYNCRFNVNMDIDTDPDVSEERYYRYYASFTENGRTYLSDTVTIWVFESFTDKELDDMEAVDDAISEFMSSKEYESLSKEDQMAQAEALLRKLASEGTPDRPYSLIEADSIFADDDMISFNYACGVMGGVMVSDWDEFIN